MDVFAEIPPRKLMNRCVDVIQQSLRSSGESVALPALMLLVNLTREVRGQEAFLHMGEDSECVNLLKLLDWIYQFRNNEASFLENCLNVLTNLTSIDVARQFVLKPERKVIPFILSNAAPIALAAVLRVVRNCCFDSAAHEAVITSDGTLWSVVVGPLVGSDLVDSKEFDEMPKLIQDLWNPGKCRSDDSNVRILVVEILQLLVRKTSTRSFMKKELNLVRTFPFLD